MKKIIIILMVIIASATTTNLLAQLAPPPPPAEHGADVNQTAGSGAPIGGGLFILLGLGAAYAGKKVYDMRKEKIEE